MYVYLSLYIYIHVYVCVYIYIYIYIGQQAVRSRVLGLRVQGLGLLNWTEALSSRSKF